MASLEKLVKAFEALKVFQPGATAEEAQKKKDVVVSRKDKILNCAVISDCICSNNLRNVQDFPKFLGIAMETLLLLCDDPESDVRMAADECLNRMIKTLMETNLGRLQVELYKEVKKNGSARCLRAALWRFADLCHLIRPQKCRPYVVNLLPCLAKICKRPEESIQETLSAAMQKLMPTLMGFTNDAEVKILLKAFLPNLKSSSATTRRTAASSLLLVCQYSRKPMMFFSWLLSVLLDNIIPVQADRDSYTVLGILLCLRHILPFLSSSNSGHLEELRGSFGVKTKEENVEISQEQLEDVFQVLLYYCCHGDHNVVTASLETLQQLLRRVPPLLLNTLLTPGGISQQTIFEKQLGMSRFRAGSQARLPSVSDDTGLEDDEGSEVTTSGSANDSNAPLMNDLDLSEADGQDSQLGSSLEQMDPEEESKDLVESEDNGQLLPDIHVTTEGAYSNIEIAEMAEDTSEIKPMSQSSSTDTLSESKLSPEVETEPLKKQASDEHLESPVAMDTDTPEGSATNGTSQIREGNIGNLTDEEEVPLVFCSRLLCSKFLLTGYKQGLITDRTVRVSVKSLAMGCMSCIIAILPRIFLKKLHKSNAGKEDLQDIRDLLLYTSHLDPQLKGTAAIMIGNLINSTLIQERGKFEKLLLEGDTSQDPSCAASLTLDELINSLLAILEDDSSVASRMSISAFKICLGAVLNSSYSHLGLKVLLSLIQLRENPYWLVKVELLELLADIDFKVISYLESICDDVRIGGHHFVGQLSLQDHVLEGTMIRLLGDEDQRVRHASAVALVSLIPRFFYPAENPQHDPIIAKAKHYATGFFDPIMNEWSQPPQSLVHGLVKPYHFNVANQVAVTTESSLMRVVSMVAAELNKSASRHLTYGCIHALCLLSEEFTVTQYACAWCCAPSGSYGTDSYRGGTKRSLSTGRSVSSVSSITSTLSGLSLEEMGVGSGGGPLPTILSILTSSATCLDISTHQDTLQLAGNLFAGASYKCLRSSEEATAASSSNQDELRWAALGDRLLVPLADMMLAHLARLLNVCTHVIEEQTPGPPASKPSLPSLPNAPSLSPIKRKAKGLKDDVASPGGQQGSGDKGSRGTPSKDTPKDSDKEKNKKDGLGVFYNLPHYMKLYEVLKGAYSNYRVSLDLSSPDKFGSMLKTVLEVFSQLLEIAALTELGKHTEELLGYFKASFTMEGTASVLCVQQLLKALFGTNLASQWESTPGGSGSRKPGKATRLTSSIKPGLYHACFTTPYTQFTQYLATATLRTATQFDQDDSTTLIGWLKKKAVRRIPAILKPGSKTDKTSVASYIRLFEPLVIKALKQYTVTSSLDLQKQVLNLLSQLVQLRVNYCLLDSDQIFIGFVIKQFEFIEEGHIRNSDTLILPIFNFLVLLSYEKYHSKSIIGMPKIIQLCDGIMASGRQATTHTIPALQCIVQDLFVVRGSSNKVESGKDLDTQREVVVSMLLRLIQYYQVLELLIVVLHQCHKEGEDKWKRLSRQVTDTVLPLLARQQVNIDNQLGLDVVHRLFEAVAPSVFRPVDILLKTLFAEPHQLGGSNGLQRWMGLVLLILQVLIGQSKEEVVLSRLQELRLGVCVYKDSVKEHKEREKAGSQAGSPAEPNKWIGSSPEETFARFLLQVIGMAVTDISEQSVQLTSTVESYSFLCQQLARLLLCITHMFQSGVYRRVASVAMRLIKKEPPDGLYSLTEINEAFRDLGSVQPLLTLQWCNVLILLNYEDQQWWSTVLQTPQQQYRLSSPNRDYQLPTTQSLLAQSRCSNMEIVRRGGLILFCDYVCENLTDAEHMTWVIINHVNDLIRQSLEPPVQDFISAIHRNSAASGLLIQAIHSRCDNLSKPSLVKKTLHCLEAIHLSQSGALLTLLVDKFLHTTHLAVGRFCDTIACRRVEMLQAESLEEMRNQLPLDDLDKLLDFMKSANLLKRHARLASLLRKLRSLIAPDATPPVSPEQTHPLASATTGIKDVHINKDWFVRITREQCNSQSDQPRQCAKLLQYLDYASILSIIMTKECSLSVLEECVALGMARTLQTVEQLRDATPAVLAQVANSPSRGRSLDPLLQAAQITLFRHINSIINNLPVPHQVLNFSASLDAKEEQYREKMEYFFTDAVWCEGLFSLESALLRYLISLPMLPWQPEVPEESIKDIGRFSILSLELVQWLLEHDQLPSSIQLQTTLECFAIVLQNPSLSAMIGQREQNSWVCSATRMVHQLLMSMLVLPRDKLVTLPNQESLDELPNASFDELYYAIRACDQMSELVHCLRTHLNPHTLKSRVPAFLASTLRNIIVGLARLPLVNSYARTPPLVWKLGWMPSPGGDMKTRLPPLPLEYLQEKDILKEFIFRVNTLGWTSRQQFEETWMSLLGVINPISLEPEQVISPEEDVDRTQCVVLAIRCITALLVQSTLSPHSGNPGNSLYEHRPRDKPLAFLHTRVGKKLAQVRGIIEREIQYLARHRSDLDTHHAYCQKFAESPKTRHLFVQNVEKEIGYKDFTLGQMSVESIWGVLGMLDPNSPFMQQQQQLDSASDSTTDTNSTVESPQTIQPPIHQVASPTEARERSSTVSGLDIHSCLQFLLELYGQFLSPSVNPRPPLMQLNETVKSVVALSDLFTERQQYEWMLEALLEVQKTHPSEDELVNQYLAVGVCKAAAVVGMDLPTADRIVKLMDASLKTTHLPTKVSVLHGCLYLLETGMSELVQQLIPLVMEYLVRTLGSLTPATVHSQQHELVMWAVAFYILENYQEEIRETDFSAKILQLSLATLSCPEDVTQLSVYLSVVRGVERLVLAGVLSRQDTETLVKLSVDRLCLPSPQRSFAALGLMLTCMYSGKHGDQWSPTEEREYKFPPDPAVAQDPESLILAMERVTVLFDRIRKGFPYEARVITRVLPMFLSDFFPPQDIMNKVIGEFLSSQQPHPQLMAKVVFQVFDNLLQKQQQALVIDWVMLSLSNFTQRTPVAMAIWSLTSFFVSASNNAWMRALFPHIVSRMGKLETVDRRLFLISALDFYGQLTDESQKRAFGSTFQTVASLDTPYSELMNCLT